MKVEMELVMNAACDMSIRQPQSGLSLIEKLINTVIFHSCSSIFLT